MELVKKHGIDYAEVVMVGNKNDLKNQRMISKEDGIKMAGFYGVKFMETSVRRNHNIAKMVTKMVEIICSRLKDRNFYA